MITIFSLPKPFKDHIGVIQTNALRSWKRIAPGCQIILFGDEPGIREAAEREGVEHVPDIARNEFGTPLLNDAFEKAQSLARNKVMCYVNGDIILLSDVRRAVESIYLKNFLVVGQRWNLDLTELVDFSDEQWEEKLHHKTTREGELYCITGMDYFIFPTGAEFAKVPPFAVGRPGWDNWFLGHARRNDVSLVNGTDGIFAIHQNHNYNHVPQSRNKSYEGPEADRNRELMGPHKTFYSVIDATHVLTNKGLKRAVGLSYLHRRWQMLPERIPLLRPIVSASQLMVPAAKWLLGRKAQT
jgi:hypothetical protein